VPAASWPGAVFFQVSGIAAPQKAPAAGGVINRDARGTSVECGLDQRSVV
jgi:hypothetical protein